MANVNHTVSIGGTRASNSISPDASRLTETVRSSDGTKTEYKGTERGQTVANSAEILPQDWLTKLSLNHFQRHKEALTRLEKSLSQIEGRKRDSGKGLIQEAEQQVVVLRRSADQNPQKKEALLKQVGEIQTALAQVKKAQTEMETQLAKEGPKVLHKTRTEAAVSRLERYYGGKIPEEVQKNPEKVRELVIGRLRFKNEALIKGRKEALAEIQKWEKLKATGSAEEKGKAEKMIAKLKMDAERFLKGEKLFTQAIHFANQWIRELEKSAIEEELDVEPENLVSEGSESGDLAEPGGEGPAPARTEVMSTGGRNLSQNPAEVDSALLGISSTGGDFDEGYSEYVEIYGTTPSSPTVSAQGRVEISGLDLSGNNLALIQSSGRLQEDMRKTRKLLDQIMRRLLAGDLRVLDLALMILSHQGGLSTIQIGAKTVKALEQLDKSQNEITKQLDSVNANDPTFSSSLAKANIQANQVAADRNSVMNMLRTVLTTYEEIQNVTKSYLDIQGAQIRHLSRFNT
ncbi:MAG: hypothetical protein HY539_04845 [Deltaproteobacteria bacterium]|nr:hypothetical protein [Deltaproteobacteria bacterium]